MITTTMLAVWALGASPSTHAAEAPSCKVQWSEAAQAGVWERVDLPETMVVRVVRGTLFNEGGGSWPHGVDVAIELVDPLHHERRYLARATVPDGRFKMKVPPGDYCFRVGVRPLGWSNVEGRIRLSRKAPSHARIEITVPLGR